jgi:hypothetical protein
VNYLQLNGFKIQVCDSGRFVPIDFEINETLEDSSNINISKFYLGNKKENKNNQMVKIDYQIKNDSIIFPSHYFLPKSYPFVFQRAKVKIFLKANKLFYTNKTAQQAFGFISKNEKPTQFWFNTNKLDDYDKWNKTDREKERKLEEKEAELEHKADNL